MKFVAYYRVSTQGQGKSGLGLDAQKKLVETVVGKDNIVDEFTDILSGKNAEREGLNKALSLCVEKGYGFIVAKIDRLSRNIKDLFHIKDIIETNNIDFKVADMPSINTLTFGLYAVMAQHEREVISKRTKEALEAKKAKGFKLGRPSTGRKDTYYIPVSSDKRKTSIEKNRENAVKKIKQNALERREPALKQIRAFLSIKPNAKNIEIMRYLENAGVPLPSGNKKWYPYAVAILRRYL